MRSHCCSSDFSSDLSSRRSLLSLSCSALISISSSLRQRLQAQVEDRLGLHLGELEALDQLGLRIVLEADDADHLVEVEIGDQVAVEHLEAMLDLLQAELRAPHQHHLAVLEPLLQHVAQRQHARDLPARQHVHVEARSGPRARSA